MAGPETTSYCYYIGHGMHEGQHRDDGVLPQFGQSGERGCDAVMHQAIVHLRLLSTSLLLGLASADSQPSK